VYLYYFGKFLEDHGIGPDGVFHRVTKEDLESDEVHRSLSAEEFYQMRLNDLERKDRRDRQRVERVVKGYLTYLSEEENWATSTCANMYGAIKSFFKAQGEEFRIDSEDKPKGQKNGSHIMDADQIKWIYNNVPWQYKKRNQAIILLLKDSGLRISDVSKLNVEHYEETKPCISPDEHEKFLAFNEALVTQKNKILAYVRLGPESVKALEDYKKERIDQGTWRTNKPLFIMDNGQRLGKKAISMIIFRLCEKKGEKKLSAHSLRKFHRTMLEAGKFPEKWIPKLQGKIGDTYVRPEELPGDELTKEYMKAYDKLRIFGVPSEKEKRMESELEKLRAELKNAREEKASEIDSLRKEMQIHDQQADEAIKRLDRMYQRMMGYLMKDKANIQIDQGITGVPEIDATTIEERKKRATSKG